MSRWAAGVAAAALAGGALAYALLVDDSVSAAGTVRLVRDTQGSGASLVSAPPSHRAFMRGHYWRMRGYPPFFDQAVKWAPPAHAYMDLYGLYRSNPKDRALIQRHPEVVLRDRQGRPLYIPYDCNGTHCAALAADPGSALWRREWVRRARRYLAAGYAGIFVDDVTLEVHVGDPSGALVAPVDPRTGEPMRAADWRRYVAGFAEAIRRALPDAEIVHNVVWPASRHGAAAVREVEAADYVEIERGLSDPTLRAGRGPFTYVGLLHYVRWAHRHGAGAIFQPYQLTPARREFELASYFLGADGSDAIASSSGTAPGNFWRGWRVSLGEPRGQSYRSHGLLRRDFADGSVVVNPPGGQAQTVKLPAGSVGLEGRALGAVRLGPRTGVVASTRDE